jgi:CO/xanthine dehydrogenase Mo-binding subunit
VTTTTGPTGAGVLPSTLAANPRLSRWLRVLSDGTVELRVGKVELGQGILTALAQIAATELGLRPDQVRSVPAHTDRGPDEGLTAGSMSVFHSGPAVRAAAANVRALFVAEAARRWQVGVADVTVADGRLSARSGTVSAGYGELAPAVSLDVDAHPELAGGSSVPGLVGRSVPRLDLPDKVTGRFRYVADLRLPGMLFGRVLRPPSPGARLVEVDTAAVETATGVVVVRDGSFLAVVAPDEAAVARAFGRLEEAANWAEADTLPDEDQLPEFLRAGPHETTTVLDEEIPPAAGRVLRARYSRPFLAHASVAPSCAVARADQDGRLMVWSHSQGIHRLRDAIAQALDLPAGLVTVEHAQNAGSYGHNGADDAAFDAALLARRFTGRPVQVRWSRADELTWGPFGPAMAAEVEATLADDGRLTSWRYDVWGQGHAGRPGYGGVPGLLAAAHLARPSPMPPPGDPPLASGAGTARNAEPLYDVGPRRVTAHRLLRAPLRTSSMRSLGAFMNVFAIECFLDEAAAAVGVDPLEFRLRHLTDDRGRQVLEAAAEAAGWGDPVPDGVGRGLGFARYKGVGAYCAVVAEVAADHDIALRRLTAAVDVGRVVNPDGVRNQIEGGATQAASWTLKERVRFDRRRITTRDWETYPILSFSEAPEVDVRLLDRPDLPSVGAGEAAQGPTAAAIGNAVAAAVEVRVRDLPLTTAAVVAAIDSEPG